MWSLLTILKRAQLDSDIRSSPTMPTMNKTKTDDAHCIIIRNAHANEQPGSRTHIWPDRKCFWDYDELRARAHCHALRFPRQAFADAILRDIEISRQQMHGSENRERGDDREHAISMNPETICDRA